jgi:lipopolysaccharide export system protein LptA
VGLTGLKNEGMVELLKDVIVTQEDFRLESNEAKIFLEDKTNEVKSVFAEGRVRITKKDEASGKLVKANGDQAEFDNVTQLITLRGNARVVKGGDILTGNLIFYNLKTGWIKFEKVKGVVNPYG